MKHTLAITDEDGLKVVLVEIGDIEPMSAAVTIINALFPPPKPPKTRKTRSDAGSKKTPSAI